MNNYSLLTGVSKENEEPSLGDLNSYTDIVSDFEDK